MQAMETVKNLHF